MARFNITTEDGWKALVVYASMILLTAASTVYSYNTNLQSDRKFCELIMNVNDAYAGAPEPATDLGKKLKQNYIDLERSLECEREGK